MRELRNATFPYIITLVNNIYAYQKSIHALNATLQVKYHRLKPVNPEIHGLCVILCILRHILNTTYSIQTLHLLATLF